MIRNIALFLLFIIPTITYAQFDSQFVFNGQNSEILKLEKAVTVRSEEEVEVPDTCTRNVANGEVRVCRDVTRYNEQCTWVPASQRCWTENDRVCRPVTRTREECSTGSSQTVCTDRPTREVCTERPTREVCTTRPDGREHCSTVGGGTHCTTVGGGQTCRDIPGERVCRDVSYTDESCENISRNRCETDAARNDCRNVPYTAEVCEMETQYRQESYACMRTETRVSQLPRTLKVTTNVQILTNGLVEEFPVLTSIRPANDQYLNFSLEVKLLKQPKLLVVLKKSNVKLVRSSNPSLLELEGTIVLEVMTKEMFPVSFPTGISSAAIEQDTQKMIIVFDGGISAQGAVDVLVTHKAFLGRTKTILELKKDYPSKTIELGQIQNKAALSIDLKDVDVGELKKNNMKMKLSLDSAVNLQGTILNEVKPDTTELYEGIFVELK